MGRKSGLNPIKRVGSHIMNTMGFAYLSKEFLTFMQMHGLFQFASNLSGMFISMFLLKSGSSVLVVGLYYLLAYFFEGTMVWMMGSIMGRVKATTVSRLGLVFFTASYIILLLFRDNAGMVFPLVAFLSALGSSFYWMPYHLYSVDYTNTQNRQLSMSLMGVVANMIILLTPPISGFIIFSMAGMSGYITVFVVSVLTFLSAALVTRSMPSHVHGSKENSVVKVLRAHWRDVTFSSIWWSHFFYGIRDGLFLYYLNLLIFTTTSNELIIGLNTTGRGILIMIVYTLIAKYNNDFLRKWASLFIGLFMIVLTLGTTLVYSAVTIILLSLIEAGLQIYNGNALQYCSYTVADYLNKKDGQTYNAGVLGIRAMGLNYGRVAGMLLFILMPPDFGSPALIMLILSVLSLPASYFIARIETILIKERETA